MKNLAIFGLFKNEIFMQIAIIDLGTNTFNLMVAETCGDSYSILLEDKYHAKLGKGGINDNTLLPEAMERGLDGLRHHINTLTRFQVERIHCFATAAIRSARNGMEFVHRVKQELDLDILVIDGQKEAELIYDGVKQVFPMSEENVLILDIGGGSNEFVVANKDGVKWKHSFNLGVARLLDRFHPSNPITDAEIAEVEAYLDAELQLLYDSVKEFGITRLVGSSGSFDTLAAVIAHKYHPHFDAVKSTSFEIKLDKYAELHNQFLKSTIDERKALKGMDMQRLELIVLGSIFINLVVKRLELSHIHQVAYALKEGAIFQLIH